MQGLFIITARAGSKRLPNKNIKIFLQVNIGDENQKSGINKNEVGQLVSFGKEIGLTDWNLMTQEKIDSFAQVTEDFQWIHLDKKRAAKESPYKKTLAHGFLILSMTSKIIFEVYSFFNLMLCF